MSRRTMLLGGLLASLTSCLAQAPAPTARLGINLAGPVDWNTELPFVDVFRLSRTWISQREGAKWGQGPALERDALGTIKRLEPGCFAETPLCTIDGGRFPQGQYTCLWDGDGQLRFNGIGRVVATEPHRIVFEPRPGSGFFLQLRATNPADPVRHLRVLMPGFEQTYQQQVFHPAFLARWKGFDTFRFMDWVHTNGSPVATWDQRSTLDSATWTERGVPLEVMIDLCNRQHANAWFCLPHQADDDFVRHFARLCRERLDPALKVYVEYSNEVWNSQFEQARYAQRKGRELGLGDAARPWEGGGMYYARRSTEIHKIFEQEFDPRRLVRVLAWQAVGAWWFENILLKTGDTAQHVDALALAPYFGLLIPQRGNGRQPDAATVAGWSVDQILDAAEHDALPASLKAMTEVKAVADRHHLRLICYEAGQHLVGVAGGENNDALTAKLLAANRHPRMGGLYTRYLDGWAAISADLMCLFSSVSRWSKWGSWGLLEYYDQTEQDQPKFKAVMDWLRRRP